MARDECGCVAWDYPHIAGDQICLDKDVDCFEQAMTAATRRILKKCQCPFSCNRVEYDYSIMELVSPDKIPYFILKKT
jgi:hypothetical protein